MDILRAMFSSADEEPQNYCRNADNVIPAFDADGNIHACHMIHERMEGDENNIQSIDDLIHAINNHSHYKNVSDLFISKFYKQNFYKEKCDNCRYFYFCFKRFILQSETLCLYNVYKINTGQNNDNDIRNTSFCITKMTIDFVFEKINREEIKLNDLL
jgi:radical SAM protein with 4Fe4S-binding SPASM domain